MPCCLCLCHSRGSVILIAPPDAENPVEALAACESCQWVHYGVWQVVDPHRPKDQVDGWTDSEGAE